MSVFDGAAQSAFDWDAPLEPARRDAILKRIADCVVARRLETPITLFLEIHRPLAPFGAQVGIALSPFIAIWLREGAFEMQEYVQLMRDPANITMLIDLIEGRSRT